LRLRLEFDTRHNEAQKSAILAETGAKLKSKTEEINILKQQIQIKDVTIKGIGEKNEQKDAEINELRRQIDTLNEEVNSAKLYANDLVSDLANLTRDKEKLELEGVFGDKDKEVNALGKEVSDLKSNLDTLESELVKARDVITTQNGRIKFMESDKKSLQLKFKEELAKVSHSMRLEVERMRDVMKKQWEEMRSLREQNFSMSKDIKDIRSLLINGCLDDDTKLQQQEGQGQTGQQDHSTPVAVPQTARGGKTVYNGYNMGALKPSLPVLNKDRKSSSRRK
jgi:chromosome segregation ATPase